MQFSPLTSVTNSSYGTEVTADALVYTGAGVVTGIIVSSHTSGAIKLYDNTAASGTVLLPTYTYATGSQFIPLGGIRFNTGVFADVTGVQDIIICINK